MVVEALRLGAVEALVKPAGAREIPEFRQQLLLKVLGAAGARYRGAWSAHSGAVRPAPVVAAGVSGRPSTRIFAVGASTTRCSHPRKSPPSSAAGSRGCISVSHEIFSKLQYPLLSRTSQVRVQTCGRVRSCQRRPLRGAMQVRGGGAAGGST